MVYNFKNKSLNLGNLKATDYKHNKHFYMPDPESPETKGLHEFRRSESKRIFLRAQKSVAPKSSTNNVPRLGSHSGNSRNINDESDFKSSRKNAKISNIESNLNREELNGLKSLKQRIDSGQLTLTKVNDSVL